MNYLVDTNILSEPRQKRPEAKVVNWLNFRLVLARMGRRDAGDGAFHPCRICRRSRGFG